MAMASQRPASELLPSMGTQHTTATTANLPPPTVPPSIHLRHRLPNISIFKSSTRPLRRTTINPSSLFLKTVTKKPYPTLSQTHTSAPRNPIPTNTTISSTPLHLRGRQEDSPKNGMLASVEAPLLTARFRATSRTISAICSAQTPPPARPPAEGAEE